MNPRHHCPTAGFRVEDDCLMVGGIALPRLAQRVGRTPFYAYDRAAMTERVGQLRAALPKSLHLHYAIKANPMPAVVQHLARLVDGLDVASGGEMRVALDTGIAPDRVSFAGPGKSEPELSQAVAAGVIVNVESARELQTLERCAVGLGIRARFALRVNPDFELKSSGMKMSGGPKQFGVDAEEVPGLLATARRMELDFVGFHIFAGSQNLRADAIVEAQCKTVELAIRLAEKAPSPIQVLNIGGGFGVPYFPGEAPLDIDPIAANLAALSDLVGRALPRAQLVLELGRYLVSESGVYVCRVVDRKTSRGEIFLVTDGGLHHHLAASGNFGQVIRKNYPVALGTRVAGTPRETATVVGPLCTPLDTLAARMEIGRAEVGDLIVVFQSGAYGPSASPASFLGHPPAIEVLI